MEAAWFTPPKRFKRVHSTGKVMASNFFYSQGVIMIDYPMQSGTITGVYYAGKWRQLCQEIARKRQGKLTRGVAPAHTSQVAMTATTECEFEILPHPPYSSDMALSDCCLISVSKTEIQSSLCAVWKQWRRHRGSKRVLVGQENVFYWRDKKDQTEMG